MLNRCRNSGNEKKTYRQINDRNVFSLRESLRLGK